MSYTSAKARQTGSINFGMYSYRLKPTGLAIPAIAILLGLLSPGTKQPVQHIQCVDAQAAKGIADVDLETACMPCGGEVGVAVGTGGANKSPTSQTVLAAASRALSLRRSGVDVGGLVFGIFSTTVTLPPMRPPSR